MTDRPIIFSAPMIRALLEGRKTQTRRIIKPPKPFAPGDDIEAQLATGSIKPRWLTGDRLWVREAWRTFVSLDKVAPRDLLTPERGAGIAFEAGGGVSIGKLPGREFRADYSLEPREDRAAFGRLRAAMHLPRWGSRITVVVTGVRVQRLQEISPEDATAEGIEFTLEGTPAGGKSSGWGVQGVVQANSPQHAYSLLWETLHGLGAWAANPWVAAISFKVALANIDAPEAKVA